MATITAVKARQIFDSRGNPTVEVCLFFFTLVSVDWCLMFNRFLCLFLSFDYEMDPTVRLALQRLIRKQSNNCGIYLFLFRSTSTHPLALRSQLLFLVELPLV